MKTAVESDSSIPNTPEQLFGDNVLFLLPKREATRQVAQLVSCAIAGQGGLAGRPGFPQRLQMTNDVIRRLPADNPETPHVRRVLDALLRCSDVLSPAFVPLVNYVQHIEEAGYLDDALQLLAVAARMHGRELPSPQFVECALHAARINRKLTRWDQAASCYTLAERLGHIDNDPVAILRASGGRSAMLRGQGRLRAAESMARRVVRDANRLSLPAMALVGLVDLSTILSDQGRYAEGLILDRETLRLSSTDDDRGRALGNIGVSLSDLGDYRACRSPLEEALACAPSLSVRLNAQLELLKVEARLDNRLAFERHRQQLEALRSLMSPAMTVDFDYKLGAAYLRFGRKRLARRLLGDAYEAATAYGLGHWRARINQLSARAECNL